jgi:hypothetical protein
MACDVFWDFGGDRQREQHKFLVSLYPTPDAKAPDLIERITARGPNGYEVEIANREFTRDNLNGWIHDRTVDAYWYMINLAGFLAPGEYVIEIACRDGSVVRASRVQDHGPTKTLLTSYLTGRDLLLDSFHPTATLPPDAALTGVVSGQRTLKDLDGTDAYYIYRLAEGGSAAEFDTQNLVWWDNIFVQRDFDGDESAGLNRGAVTIGVELKPHRRYAYFVEITDANRQRDTNICIFQPHQFFTTP